MYYPTNFKGQQQNNIILNNIISARRFFALRPLGV
jgi:hypothetical protein|tara:strand:+ start:1873 stop:1977 length:105 start_codon:yes stop_codon:yes gene_type:complete